MDFHAASDVGLVRENNEDYHDHVAGSGRDLFILADGMGGLPGGEVASSVAGRAARDHFLQDPLVEPRDLLRGAILAAHHACQETQILRPELSQMGTTLELALVDGDSLWWGHVGDSRQYLITEATPAFKRLTTDQTVVQRLVDEGRLSPAEARNHPMRNLLNSVVGSESDPQIEVCREPVEVTPGEYLIMCSDGLTDLIDDEEIASMTVSLPPGQVCADLIALAKQRGGHDNITVQAIRWSSATS